MEKKAGFYMPLFILCSGDRLRDRESEGESRKKGTKRKSYTVQLFDPRICCTKDQRTKIERREDKELK